MCFVWGSCTLALRNRALVPVPFEMCCWIQLPLMVFQSHSWQQSRSDSGLHVTFLDLDRVSGFASYMSRNILSPCNYLLFAVAVCPYFHSVETNPEEQNELPPPKNQRFSLHIAFLLRPPAYCFHSPNPALFRRKQLRRNLLSKYYFGKKCYFRWQEVTSSEHTGFPFHGEYNWWLLG